MVMIDLTRFSPDGFNTADNIKPAQKPCQNKPSQVSQTDESQYYKIK